MPCVCVTITRRVTVQSVLTTQRVPGLNVLTTRSVPGLRVLTTRRVPGLRILTTRSVPGHEVRTPRLRQYPRVSVPPALHAVPGAGAGDASGCRKGMLPINIAKQL